MSRQGWLGSSSGAIPHRSYHVTPGLRSPHDLEVQEIRRHEVSVTRPGPSEEVGRPAPEVHGEGRSEPPPLVVREESLCRCSSMDASTGSNTSPAIASRCTVTTPVKGPLHNLVRGAGGRGA